MRNLGGSADALNIGVIGVGGQGRFHVGHLAQLGLKHNENCKVGMICDVYRRAMKRSQDVLKGVHKDLVLPEDKCVIEYEKVMDNKDINAVVIASPSPRRLIPSARRIVVQRRSRFSRELGGEDRVRWMGTCHEAAHDRVDLG